MRSRREPDFCSSTVVSGNGFLQARAESVTRRLYVSRPPNPHHFCVGLVSHLVTVASESISTIVKTASAIRWSYSRPRLQENEVVVPSRRRPTWMFQNDSGTKALTRSYWSTTNPRVGNWQGPAERRSRRQISCSS